MKRTILILILLITFGKSVFANKAIIKASVLRGEGFVTVNIPPKDIEDIIGQALAQRGFQVISEVVPDEAIFYVDLFVYQFPADYPTIALSIRTSSGIHFFDKEKIKLYVDRKVATLKIASMLAERLPAQIDTERAYCLTLADILINDRISLIGLTSNAITEEYRSNYSSSIKWNDSPAPSFIVPNNFDGYLAYVSNFQGMRLQLSGKTIQLLLKINLRAEFELVKLESPIALTEKQKERIHEFIQSFPLWIVDQPFNNIELSYGID